MTLDEIGIKHQTDKASQFSRTYAKPHDYLRQLWPFFEPWRNYVIKIVEVGVGGGESVQVWLEYFIGAKVYGVDVVSGTNCWNTPGESPNARYTFVQGNQGNAEFWEKFIKDHGGNFHIIIDDGSHVHSDVRATFDSLWSHLKSGGIYEIEDLNAIPETSEWLQGLSSRILSGNSGIDSITFSKELAILKKR